MDRRISEKERILPELDSTGPEHFKQILEQELQLPEQSAHEEILDFLSFVMTKSTGLKPTGDDDKM